MLKQQRKKKNKQGKTVKIERSGGGQRQRRKEIKKIKKGERYEC